MGSDVVLMRLDYHVLERSHKMGGATSWPPREIGADMTYSSDAEQGLRVSQFPSSGRDVAVTKPIRSQWAKISAETC